MSKKKLLVMVGITFICAIIFVLVNQGMTDAQECRIVRIWGKEAPPSFALYIEPRTMRVSKDTCVVWSNWVKTSEIQIVFKDGKKCEDVTDAATGFSMDAANCFVTNFLARGETSSLRFTQEGTYHYEVKSKGGPTEKGKILVK